MSIGKRLEEERKSKGYKSQNALADALSISYPTISRWENDSTAIPSDKCALMSELGLDILYILTGKPAASPVFERNNNEKTDDYKIKTGDVHGFENEYLKDKEIDIDKVSERLLSERQRLGLSQSDVADRLNVDYKTVARLEKGTELGVSKLSGLAQLGFDIAYILSGNRYQNKEQPKDIDDDYAFIPLYDIDVSAGGGSFFDSERIKTRLSFTRYSLKQQGLSPEHLACVRCRGDSMLPTIAERDTIMIDLRRKAVDGGIFVFRHEDSLFVKRLIREKGGIRVISDNQIYPEWFIEPEDNYEIIGKKVWQARWDR